MRIAFAGAVLAVCVMSVGAQEFGRGSLRTKGDTSGLGRAPLPLTKDDGFVAGGVWGLNVGVGWANVDWTLGPASGSESLFAPEASLFYKTTDNLELSFSTMFLSAKDQGGELGDTTADMTRLALGLRYRVNTQTRVKPYVGGGLGYYLLDGMTDNTRKNGLIVPVNSASVSDGPGAFLECGVSFQVDDGFFINADLTYDFLLGSSDATINDKNESFDVTSLGLKLGATWLF